MGIVDLMKRGEGKRYKKRGDPPVPLPIVIKKSPPPPLPLIEKYKH